MLGRLQEMEKDEAEVNDDKPRSVFCGGDNNQIILLEHNKKII